jgi:hypothetical protein
MRACRNQLALLVPIIRSDRTPDDRGDVPFMALVSGGLFWGILAGVTVVARVLQWRILKRSMATQTATGQHRGVEVTCDRQYRLPGCRLLPKAELLCAESKKCPIHA